jgi:hypothetical protein
MEKGEVMTRTLFCAEYYQHNRKFSGRKYVVFGNTSKKYFIFTGDRNGERGFSPHIITFVRNEDDSVLYQTYCSVDKCGVLINEKNFVIQERHTLTTSPEHWKALLERWKDTGYYI